MLDALYVFAEHSSSAYAFDRQSTCIFAICICVILLFHSTFFASNNSSTYKFPKITLFRMVLILSIIALARGLIDSGISYKSFMRLYPAPKLFMPYFWCCSLGVQSCHLIINHL